MKKGWTTTKLIAAGSMGVLLLVLSLFGAGLASVTGIPITSGFVNVFVSGAMFAVCCLIFKEFGAATIMGTLYSILAIPLFLFGTPGFLPKVVVGILTGLVADFIYLFLKRYERFAAVAIGGCTQLLIATSVVYLGRLFGMPGVEQAAKMFLSPLFLFGEILLGGIAGYLGWLIYLRVKNTSVVKRIQGA